MNKNVIKKLALISASLILTSTFVAASPSQTVEAVSQKTYTKYSRKFNKVVALRPMQVYKVHPGKYAFDK